MRELSARIILDPADLPAGHSPEVADLLREVRALLSEIRERLDADSRLAVSPKEAAAMLGICERSLSNHGIPHVMIGSRKVYRIEALRQWLQEQEAAPLAK